MKKKYTWQRSSSSFFFFLIFFIFQCKWDIPFTLDLTSFFLLFWVKSCEAWSNEGISITLHYNFTGVWVHAEAQREKVCLKLEFLLFLLRGIMFLKYERKDTDIYNCDIQMWTAFILALPSPPYSLIWLDGNKVLKILIWGIIWLLSMGGKDDLYLV